MSTIEECNSTTVADRVERIIALAKDDSRFAEYELIFYSKTPRGASPGKVRFDTTATLVDYTSLSQLVAAEVGGYTFHDNTEGRYQIIVTLPDTAAQRAVASVKHTVSRASRCRDFAFGFTTMAVGGILSYALNHIVLWPALDNITSNTSV